MHYASEYNASTRNELNTHKKLFFIYYPFAGITFLISCRTQSYFLWSEGKVDFVSHWPMKFVISTLFLPGVDKILSPLNLTSDSV